MTGDKLLHRRRRRRQTRKERAPSAAVTICRIFRYHGHSAAVHPASSKISAHNKNKTRDWQKYLWRFVTP